MAADQRDIAAIRDAAAQVERELGRPAEIGATYAVTAGDSAHFTA